MHLERGGNRYKINAVDPKVTPYEKISHKELWNDLIVKKAPIALIIEETSSQAVWRANRGISPPTPWVLVQWDQSNIFLLKTVSFVLKKSFNPPPTQTQRPSPGGSIPHYPGLLSWGNNDPLILYGKLRINTKSFNPPPPRVLVQGDQSPTYYDSSPQGLEKQSVQSPTYWAASPGGSIPHLLWL